MFELPSYEDCVDIVKAHPNFFEAKFEFEGFLVSMFSYRMSSPSTFKISHNNREINAYELRGLTFIHGSAGTNQAPQRFLMMHKFFNLNETEELSIENVRKLRIKFIQEKIDGSLVRFIRLPDGKIVAKTKMSFQSQAAQIAQQEFNQNRNFRLFIESSLDSKAAALFEVTSPQGLNVVNCSETQITLLHIRDENTGEYLNPKSFLPFLEHPVKYLKPLNQSISLEQLIQKAETAEEFEGWVLGFENNLFIKLKTQWYRALHKVLTSFLTKEHHIIDRILRGTLDDTLAKLYVNDPRRLKSLQIQELVLEELTRMRNDTVSIIEDYDGDRKAWALRNIGKETFTDAGAALGSDYDEVLLWEKMKRRFWRKVMDYQNAKKWVEEALGKKQQLSPGGRESV